jgi:hypothetical protein
VYSLDNDAGDDLMSRYGMGKCLIKLVGYVKPEKATGTPLIL